MNESMPKPQPKPVNEPVEKLTKHVQEYQERIRKGEVKEVRSQDEHARLAELARKGAQRLDAFDDTPVDDDI